MEKVVAPAQTYRRCTRLIPLGLTKAIAIWMILDSGGYDNSFLPEDIKRDDVYMATLRANVESIATSLL